MAEPVMAKIRLKTMKYVRQFVKSVLPPVVRSTMKIRGTKLALWSRNDGRVLNPSPVITIGPNY